MFSQRKTASLFKINRREAVIKISFPYDPEEIERIRTLPGRKYHQDSRCWSAPIFPKTIEQLRDWDFHIDPALSVYLLQTQTEAERVNISNIPGLKGDLFPFQKEGIAFIEANKGRALIADEMGLGKTVQAIGWLQLHKEKRPAIIVVPASLKYNWQSEINRWMSSTRIQILSGTSPYHLSKQTDIFIINYDILHAWVDQLKVMGPKVLITDECHYYKSNQAKRTKAIKMLGKSIPHIIALSGTPIVNRPIEAFNAIKLINPLLFKDQMSFARRYCGAHHTGFGWDFSGATNTQELNDLLKSSVMIRRLKSEVLKELPDKIKSFTPIELDNESDYRFAEDDFIGYIKKTKGVEASERISNTQALAAVEGLKQLAVKGKLKEATDWIRNFLEVDGKLVVFVTHHFVSDHLMQEFGPIAVKIDGTVSAPNRQQIVSRFQSDSKIRLFVGNIKAAGVGLTLTASSNVAFLELPWTPGELVQAEDRCHRIGQKDTVNVYYLLARGTIEEKIARIIDKKRKILDSVLDGKETDQDSLLSELIKEYV